MYGRLIQCKPVQTMTLKFFGATLVRVHCTKYCILTLISNSLKITKSQELVKFNSNVMKFLCKWLYNSSNFLPIFQGRAAEHIPCQNSWEISGNCEDPFQVKFVFHTVCQVLLFFWHVRCRLHMFFPKEDPYFQQVLEMS